MSRFSAGIGLCGLVISCARHPNVTSNQLPLQRVVVYRNGVGYFERAGKVGESEVAFQMRQHAVGDFLATLAIVERGGSTVRSASFPIEIEDKYERAEVRSCTPEPGKCPPLPPKEPKERNPLRKVSLRLDGREHDLAVGYVAETPVWRPSYRVVINANGEAELQSWGIVQNLSGEDWRDVDLVLVAGAPLAFQSTLGTPITPERPIVSDSGEVISAMPEGLTSLHKQQDGEVTRVAPEEKEAAPEPAPAMAGAAAPAPPPAPGRRLAKEAVSASPKLAAKRRMVKLSSVEESQLDERAVPSAEMATPAARFAPQAPSAPRSLSILAGVAVESGVTRYSVPYPITVPDESATMVLLASQKVPGESVFLFAPDGGVSDSVRHPFRVARFSNSTAGLLERGPIAVFERGSFLGQGMLDSLPIGATATVPFALERGIAIEQSTSYDERGARLYKIESSQITVERDSVSMTTYKLTNGMKESVKMLVRHPRSPGTRLFHPPAGTEDNAALGNALVPISMKPNGRGELVVDERRAQTRSVGWLDALADDAVKAFLSDPRAPRDKATDLAAAWDIRGLWKRQVDEQSRLVTERNEIERNLSQLHDSLKAIEKNAQAADLRQKLTRKLGDASTRIDQITKRLVEVELGMREQEVRFREAISELKILSVPPPKE